MKPVKQLRFEKIGIVGWKDKSPDLALALENISEWASSHPQVRSSDSVPVT